VSVLEHIPVHLREQSQPYCIQGCCAVGIAVHASSAKTGITPVNKKQFWVTLKTEESPLSTNRRTNKGQDIWQTIFSLSLKVYNELFNLFT